MDILYWWILFVYTYLYFIFVQGQSTEGDIRLRRGDSDGSGYVEIYHGGTWGRVCDTGWTHDNAHVVCKQLDYNGALVTTSRPSNPSNPALPALLNNLACTGAEKQLTDCPGSEWLAAGSNCQAASVMCMPYLSQHLGCYNDNTERVLPNYSNCLQEPRCNCDFTKSGCVSETAMTVELCKDICCNGDVKYAFAGVETGEQCFCGVSTVNYKEYDQLDNRECHMRCAGNPSESCGADYKINVYGCNLGCEVPGILSPNLSASPPLVFNQLYNEGNTISFTCLGGTTLTGDSQITCQAGGAWSGALPRCQTITITEAPVITCPLPSGGSNLLFSPIKPSYAVGDSIVFRCASGFEVVGAQTLTCQNNGLWGGVIPTCIQVTACGPLTGLDRNAIPSTQANDVGTTVTFTCAPGFVMLAGTNPRKECQAGGWVGPNPVCQTVAIAVTCPKPTVPEKSTYTPVKDTYASGDTVTIQCSLGFKPDGLAQMTCNNDGKWSAGAGTCAEIICDPLSIYPNVIPSNSATEIAFATSVSFRCEECYIMATSRGQTPYKTCNIDGWVGPDPNCAKIECGPIPQYPHATANNEQVTCGTEVSYTCHTGYRTTDRNLVKKTCNKDGKWEPYDTVQCQVIDCGTLPATDKNAFPSTLTDTFYGTIVTYQCHPGYSLKNNIIATKTCSKEGDWTGQDPVCEPTVCSPLPQYPFAIPSTTSTKMNTVVMYTCQEGSMIMGSSAKKTCQESGQWVGNDPNCVDIDECANSPCVNGAPCVNLLNKYVCNCSPGFSGINCETVGPGGGTGTGNETSCDAVPLFDHAIPSSTTTTEIAATILYTCDEGYEHTGNPPYKQCLPTGIWDGQAPQCRPVSCGRPEVPTHLSIGTAQDFTFGQTITYMCTDRTLTPSPYVTVKCESTKLWSKPPPAECLVIAVTNPPIVTDNGNGNTTPSTNRNNGTNTTVPTGGVDGNTGGTDTTSGGLPVSIWIVILIALIALGIFFLGFILMKRQHEDARRRYGIPKKRRKSRSQLYGSTTSTNSALTAEAVTPTFKPRAIPIIREPGDSESSIPSADPEDEIDLTLQTPSYASAPPPKDAYMYENEVEPDYISDTASNVGSAASPSVTSTAGSDVDEEGPTSDAEAPIEGEISQENAQRTEASPPETNDESAKKDEEVDKVEDEGKFIDNLIDNAKSKIDDCVIS